MVILVYWFHAEQLMDLVMYGRVHKTMQLQKWSFVDPLHMKNQESHVPNLDIFLNFWLLFYPTQEPMIKILAT